MNIEAQEVRVGDRIYDRGFFASYRWCVVKAVTETFGNISIQLSHVTLVKNPRESVAVQRG